MSDAWFIHNIISKLVTHGNTANIELIFCREVNSEYEHPVRFWQVF
jgi:hypothetical protein